MQAAAAGSTSGRTGAALLVTSRILSYGATALMWIALARILGPTQYGHLAAGAAVAALLQVLGLFGLDQLFLARRIDQSRFVQSSNRAIALTLALVLVSAAVWPVDGTTRWCILLVGIALLFDLAKLPALLQFQVRLDFAARAYREIGFRLLSMATGLVVGLLTKDPVAVAAGLAAASVASLVVLDRSLFTPWRESEFLQSARRGAPYAASGALYTAYWQSGIVMLTLLGTIEQVGQYRAAFSVVMAATVLPVALNNEVMRTRLFALAQYPALGVALSLRLLLVNLVLGLAVGGLVALLHSPLVSVLFGSAFQPAADALLVLALALLFGYLNSWAGNYLVVRHRLRLVLSVQATMLVVMLVGDVLLIPDHGLAGAAWATVIGELVGFTLYAPLAIGELRRHRQATTGSPPDAVILGDA